MPDDAKSYFTVLRAESLYSMIAEAGGELVLDEANFEELSRRGLSRSDVENAASYLSGVRKICAIGTNAGISLRATAWEEKKREREAGGAQIQTEIYKKYGSCHLPIEIPGEPVMDAQQAMYLRAIAEEEERNGF